MNMQKIRNLEQEIADITARNEIEVRELNSMVFVVKRLAAHSEFKEEISGAVHDAKKLIDDWVLDEWNCKFVA